MRRVLTDAGFSRIKLERCDLSFDIAQGRGLEAAVETALTLGPTMRALRDVTTDVMAAAKRSIREALAPLVTGQSVPLGVGIWIATAINP